MDSASTPAKHSAQTLPPVVSEGVVTREAGGKLWIALREPDGCRVCSKGLCFSAGAESRLFTAPNDSHNIHIGDHVRVLIQRQGAELSVAVLYGIPAALVILTLFIAVLLVPEGIAGLLSLGILVPYYTLVHLFDHRLRQRCHVFVERL